ncbi:MAG: hypothetical protein RLZZ416_281 [Candidatus Parcubacteria bacterium]|jgi:hypothetical protein
MAYHDDEEKDEAEVSEGSLDETMDEEEGEEVAEGVEEDEKAWE